MPVRPMAQYFTVKSPFHTQFPVANFRNFMADVRKPS
jgi:hypothetical protein